MQLPVLLKQFRHLLRPTRGGAAGVLVVFALLLSLAAKAGLLGITLSLILISWFLKYAYILFDHTVRGFDEPPILDIQMLNPVDEQRPLGQVIIISLILAALYFVRIALGNAVSIILGGFVAVLLPASVAILGLEGNILKAAYPVAWVRMMLGLGPWYALVLAVIVFYAVLLSVGSHIGLWMPVSIGLSMFAILSVFSLLGGALYERRDELGIETWASPERTEEKKRRQTLKDNETIVTEAYGLMRAGAHVKSWELLQKWLDACGHAPDDYAWARTRVATWDDPRYITRLTEEHLERLLALKRTGEALDVIAQYLRVDPTFRPKSAATTLGLAQIAARGGGSPRVARMLLSDFAARFPGDMRVPVAAALADYLGA